MREGEEREKVVILIRLQLSFGLIVTMKGQAEKFVFHYVVRSRGLRKNEGLQEGEDARGESWTNEVGKL